MDPLGLGWPIFRGKLAVSFSEGRYPFDSRQYLRWFSAMTPTNDHLSLEVTYQQAFQICRTPTTPLLILRGNTENSWKLRCFTWKSPRWFPENHFPKPPFWGSMLMFQGGDDNLTGPHEGGKIRKYGSSCNFCCKVVVSNIFYFYPENWGRSHFD